MRRLCALLGITRSGYYAWRSRAESARRQQDRSLLKDIREVFEKSRGTYGSPRVHRKLLALGMGGQSASRRAVNAYGRATRPRGPDLPLEGRSTPCFARNPNLLWKHQARRPDQVWVGDITYLPIPGGWRYLAIVMDQHSRRLLGWSLSRGRGDSKLTRTALDQAMRKRRPPRGLIFHSDRGIEYAGLAMEKRLKGLHLRQSMTRGGCPGDNAHAESFFHSLKADVIHGDRFETWQLRRAASVRRLLQPPAPTLVAGVPIAR